MIEAIKTKEHCIIHGTSPSYVHNLISAIVRPDLKDKEFNCINVCKACLGAFHKMGMHRMANRHPEIKEWLFNQKWSYDGYLKKWSHMKTAKSLALGPRV